MEASPEPRVEAAPDLTRASVGWRPCTKLSFAVWELSAYAAIKKHRNPLELHKASAPEPFGTARGICTGTLRNLTGYLHRNPPEPHHVSAPEPFTRTFRNLTMYLHRNPSPEPSGTSPGICTGTLQNLTRYLHRNNLVRNLGLKLLRIAPELIWAKDPTAKFCCWGKAWWWLLSMPRTHWNIRSCTVRLSGMHHKSGSKLGIPPWKIDRDGIVAIHHGTPSWRFSEGSSSSQIHFYWILGPTEISSKSRSLAASARGSVPPLWSWGAQTGHWEKFSNALSLETGWLSCKSDEDYPASGVTWFWAYPLPKSGQLKPMVHLVRSPGVAAWSPNFTLKPHSQIHIFAGYTPISLPFNSRFL